MEFRLNKIDTELRQIVNDSTKEGKVHGNKGISSIDKDGKRDKENDNSSFKKQFEEKREKKIVVDAVKTKEIDVKASKEESMPDLTFGRFLDIKL